MFLNKGGGIMMSNSIKYELSEELSKEGVPLEIKVTVKGADKESFDKLKDLVKFVTFKENKDGQGIE
jgi:uncharacterized Fe-S cluster-containing radical SAM superfamily protein